MNPTKLSSLIVVFGIAAATVFVDYSKQYKTIQTATSPADPDTVLSVIHQTDSDEYLFVVSGAATPFKFLFGQTLFRSHCRNRQPGVHWRDSRSIDIYCGTDKQQVAQTSFAVVVY